LLNNKLQVGLRHVLHEQQLSPELSAVTEQFGTSAASGSLHYPASSSEQPFPLTSMDRSQSMFGMPTKTSNHYLNQEQSASSGHINQQGSHAKKITKDCHDVDAILKNIITLFFG
jgi:hypothetical protein